MCIRTLLGASYVLCSILIKPQMVGLTPCLQMRTFMIRVTTTYLKRVLNGRNQDSDLHLSEFKVPVVLATLYLRSVTLLKQYLYSRP